MTSFQRINQKRRHERKALRILQRAHMGKLSRTRIGRHEPGTPVYLTPAIMEVSA